MALILHIETSSKACSVAISSGSTLLAHKTLISEQFAHAEKLHPLIAETLQTAAISASDLQAVSVSKGPGSYTGLRIGVSAAKGFCYANRIPLIAVDTLEAIAHHGRALAPSASILVPMIDARRMEVYTASFSASLDRLEADFPFIIDQNSMTRWKDDNAVFCGDGAHKCQSFLRGQQEVHSFYPDATMLVEIAAARYNKQLFEDLAYFEPFYLKDYIPGTSVKNKI